MNEIIINRMYQSLISLVAILILGSLITIITQTNPVYAVFSFIITAILVFLLLILVGAEFFALLILIIYTGVITVLFLFVVIMYNFRVLEFTSKSFLMHPVLYLVIYKIFWINRLCQQCLEAVLKQQIQMNTSFFTLDVTQFVALFNDHFFLFLVCGLLIFIAMVGSIVITYPFYKHLNTSL